MIFRARANAVLDRMEDPRETLDYSYQTQLELLAKIRRGVSDVAASRGRAELQMSALRRERATLEDQAGLAPDGKREHRERETLQRTAIDTKLRDLGAERDSLDSEEEKLTAARDRLAAKVEAFRVKKEVISATYTAAEAQDRANQVWSRICDEIGDTGISAIPCPRQRELLTQLQGGISQIALSRERLEEIISTLREQQNELASQASQSASRRDQEDQALESVAQKAEVDRQLPELMTQLNSLQMDEEKLSTEYERLRVDVETSHAQNEPTNAICPTISAEAQNSADAARSTIAAQDDPN